MKTFLLFLSFSLAQHISSFGQFTNKNHLGINLSAGTGSRFTYMEYERFFGKHFSIAPRLGIFHYREINEKGDIESGNGLGFGCSARYHFGKKPVQGFFLGAGVDAYQYKYLLIFLEKSIAPQFQAGFHILAGESIYLQPIITIGALNKLSMNDNEIESQEMFFRGGITMGIRF